MVTYNHAPYICQAIDSVLAQRTDFPYRLVVGDDGSTDGTADIIRDYANRHPGRIVSVLQTRHVGMVGQKRLISLILPRCTAPYLALLEGDDYWTDPLKLQKQVDHLESHLDHSMCFHWSSILEQETGRMLDDRVGPAALLSSFTFDDLLEQCGLIPTNSVVYRNYFKGVLPDWWHHLPNADLVLHALHASRGPMGFLDEVMAVYRLHKGAYWSTRSRTEQLGKIVDAYLYLGRKMRIASRPAFRRGTAQLYVLLSKHLKAERRRFPAAWAAWKGFRMAPPSFRVTALGAFVSTLPWTPKVGLSRILLAKRR